MLVNLARNGSLRTAQCLCILAALLLGRALAQSQAPAKDNGDPKTWPYDVRLTARGFGNIGRWWSLMNENDKAAFLDGYQEAMRQARSHDKTVCEAMLQTTLKNPNSPIEATEEVIFMCSTVSDTAEYDKVTVKALDNFYSDPANQFIVLGWSMGHLRDKASGRKTEGQLLDALKAEQKDIHDCSKYPHICKAGITESQPLKSGIHFPVCC